MIEPKLMQALAQTKADELAPHVAEELVRVQRQGPLCVRPRYLIESVLSDEDLLDRAGRPTKLGMLTVEILKRRSVA